MKTEGKLFTAEDHILLLISLISTSLKMFNSIQDCHKGNDNLENRGG